MKSEWKLRIFNPSGEELFFGTVTSLPLSDELIIKKSMEFFNDEAPCFIHRSAVLKRLYLELEAFAAKKYGKPPQVVWLRYLRMIFPTISS